MKIITCGLSICLLYTICLTAQERAVKPLKNVRDGYVYISVGLPDFIAFGTGLQVTHNSSLGIKYGPYLTNGRGRSEGAPIGLNAGAGFGLKYSLRISESFFNTVNAELTLFNSESNKLAKHIFIKGAAYDINIGYYNIHDTGFNFFWAAGVVISTITHTPPLIMPVIRTGFNLNF